MEQSLQKQVIPGSQTCEVSKLHIFGVQTQYFVVLGLLNYSPVFSTIRENKTYTINHFRKIGIGLIILIFRGFKESF